MRSVAVPGDGSKAITGKMEGRRRIRTPAHFEAFTAARRGFALLHT
jgi:hypothetical protein